MIKETLFLCLVSRSITQWVDPDWKMNSWVGQGSQKYPPLPGSYPVFVKAPSPSVPTSISTKRPTQKPTTVPITTKPTAPPSTCSKMFSCANCGTAQVCRPTGTSYVPLYTIPCHATSPYCNADTGSCSSTPDPTCGTADTFICPGNGYFPDPTNCTIYHACNNYKSQMFKCAENQSYNPDKAECTQGEQCNYEASCSETSVEKLQLGDTHYYTYCSGGKPIVVSRCPGHYKLNTTSQICEPLCEEDGLMADLEDCNRFYQCTTMYVTANLSVPVRKNLNCPSGEAFAPDSFQCIPKTMTNCTMPN